MYTLRLFILFKRNLFDEKTYLSTPSGRARLLLARWWNMIRKFADSTKWNRECSSAHLLVCAHARQRTEWFFPYVTWNNTMHLVRHGKLSIYHWQWELYEIRHLCIYSVSVVCPQCRWCVAFRLNFRVLSSGCSYNILVISQSDWSNFRRILFDFHIRTWFQLAS